MTIDEIREIVISPDAIMRKEWGKVLLNEIDRLTARAEKAEAEVKFNKAKLRYAADLLLKDKQEYISLAKDHYWDSMENNKDIILKHIEAIWELWERQDDYENNRSTT